MFEVIGAIAAVASAAIALVQLVRDIIKDGKQKSNRPHQG